MSRQDNMLEAFRDATRGSGSEDAAAGPFAGAPTPSSGTARGSASDPRRWIVAIAALGLVFVLGVWVGRVTAGTGLEDEAHASETDEASAWLPPEDPTPTPATKEPEALPDDTPSDVAPLYDRANKYTVVAISVTRANEDLAWSNHDHLRANDLPAFRPIETNNGMLVILVGAAPKESDLKDVRSRLQRLAGPDGRGQPYSGAYFSPIAPLVGRGEDG